MNAHIIKHFQATASAKIAETYNQESPYVTLLKPASYPSNPWYEAGAGATELEQEDISVADSAIKAVFVDGLKMTVNQVAAHAHTKQKNSLQPILAMTLARHLPVENIGDLYDQWLEGTRLFPFRSSQGEYGNVFTSFLRDT